ncbi:MAG TPA: hypothetical protein VNH46_09770, partial [Gemmatimonadales bacterium]|nr:hypothetical protein [Gemmatimonadales bacterium]
MAVPSLRCGAGILLGVVLGCRVGAGPVPAPGDSGLPPVPRVAGPLHISVAYPAPTDVIDVGDSTFLFGSVGTGDATLTVNGDPVPVAPNGAWLAWIAVAPDTLLQFTLVAHTASDSASLVYPVRRVRRFVPPDTTVWVDSSSFAPAGPVWWPADEYLPLRVRAAADADVSLVLPDGSRIPLVPWAAAAEIPWGIRAF